MPLLARGTRSAFRSRFGWHLMCEAAASPIIWSSALSGGIAGSLLLLTGLWVGGVGFAAELHDSRPDVDESWEEIVEVSFRPVSGETVLRQWNGAVSWELGLEEGDYRVRYSAIAMDAGRSRNVREDDEPQTDDRYLLQFWPAALEPARLLKQTGRAAASSHKFATAPVG